jgi:hypothetical protein
MCQSPRDTAASGQNTQRNTLTTIGFVVATERRILRPKIMSDTACLMS